MRLRRYYKGELPRKDMSRTNMGKTMTTTEAIGVFTIPNRPENTFTSGEWVNMDITEQQIAIREDCEIIFTNGDSPCTFKIRQANRGEDWFTEDAWKYEGFVMWSGEGTQSDRERVFEAMAIIMSAYRWDWNQTDCGSSFMCKFE